MEGVIEAVELIVLEALTETLTEGEILVDTDGSWSQKPTDSDSEIVGVALTVIDEVGVTVRVSVRVGVIEREFEGVFGGV